MHRRVRPSAIAGSWYPGDPVQLRRMIEDFLKEASIPPVEREIIGLISPHAGYLFSGQTAAFGYRAIQGHSYEEVVLLAPTHHWPVARYQVVDADAYETPLGLVPIQKELTFQVLEGLDAAWITHDPEHALEIQLPFLQVVLDRFSIVPLMIGHADVDAVNDLVDNLVRVFRDRSHILFIASSDLHHLHDYQDVVASDQRVIQALETNDLSVIRQILSEPASTVCGRVPISVLADVASRLGAPVFQTLDYRNSGEITGERRSGQYTVGYLSGIFIR